MKAAMNKITEGAKLRDTIGRNQSPVISTRGMSASELISTLFNYQLTVSSDNVEKITNVIILDDNNRGILLKYRGLTLVGMTADQATALQHRVNFVLVPEQDEALQIQNEDDIEEGDNNDK